MSRASRKWKANVEELINNSEKYILHPYYVSLFKSYELTLKGYRKFRRHLSHKERLCNRAMNDYKSCNKVEKIRTERFFNQMQYLEMEENGEIHVSESHFRDTTITHEIL